MVGVEPLAGHPTGGALCAKGRAAPEIAGSPRRLTRPMKRTGPRGEADPGWVEISWDEALDTIAARLGTIRADHGAEAVAFAVTTPSGTPMVDSFEWVERFIRGFGSPNLIYAVEVCGWHKDYAHALTFGRGIGFPDYDKAETIVLWGHNPARTWLAQATRVVDARRRGATVVVVDPKPDGSGQQADLWLRIRPGADAALAMGAVRHLIRTGGFDQDFVRRWTNAPLLVDGTTGRFLRAETLWAGADAGSFVVLGEDGAPRAYDARRALDDAGTVALSGRLRITGRDGEVIDASTVFDLLSAEAEPYTPAHVAALTWLGEAEIEAFNRLFAGRPKLAYHSWTGVGQHSNATAIERAIASLYALTGACDREGGNLWPVPPPTRPLNDLAILPQAQKAKALGLAELPLGPPAKAWITARDFARAAIEGDPYRVRALVGFGSNFVVSQGGSARNRDALLALDFQVHIDMFMNPTAELADIVLPANTPWERDALKIGFEITQAAVETIQFRPRMIETAGEARADYEIAAALAVRLGMDELFFGGDIEAGWNHQLEPLGITVDDLRRHPEGLRFPQSFTTAKYARTAADGTVAGFPTPTRRVELYSELMLTHGYPPLPGHVEPAESPLSAAPDPRFPLVLTTAKSGWFVHTSHRHIASLRRKSPDPSADISPGLARRLGLAQGDWVIVETPEGEARVRLRLNPALDDRVVVAEFGWWEDCPPLGRARTAEAGVRTSNLNAILSDRHRDPVSGSVPLRAVTCALRRDEAANAGSWTGSRAFTVVDRAMASEDVVALTLAPEDGGPLPAFHAGQHVMLALPDRTVTRAYSLTGAGDRPDRLSLAVQRRVASKVSAEHMPDHVHALGVGDTVLLEPPSGLFTLPLDSPRPLVLVAAGIGITPFLSQLETLAARSHVVSMPKILLLHGCRHGGQHPFADRLAALAEALPGLAVETFYSAPRPEDLSRHRRGRIDLDRVLPLLAGRPLAYLCGSPGFVADTTEGLVARGMPRFDIFAEAFATPPEVPASLVPQTVRIAGSDQSFVWAPAAGTLLDAAQAAGIALPSGCRVGQCESCVMQVVDGDVAHLGGFAGEDGHCLTCQSVPLSALTLAF